MTRIEIIKDRWPRATPAAVQSMLKLTRIEFANAMSPYMWRRRFESMGDRLAFRAHLLFCEGRETLHNAIFMDHDRPKKY